jgi:hypothetical protein
VPQSSVRCVGQGREGAAGLQREVDTEILVEKEQTIQELRETVEILESKVGGAVGGGLRGGGGGTDEKRWRNVAAAAVV